MTDETLVPPKSLDDVRREIDAVDASLHDLLMKRAALVAGVAEAKAHAASMAGQGSFIALRPGREAQILRALAARHRGSLPLEVVFRLWRELIAANTRLQGPFRVELFGGADLLGVWDLARSYYGSGTEMTAHETARGVLDQVAQDRSALGVLPAPGPGAENWWTALEAQGPCGAKVVARLPFLERSGEEGPAAFAVAQAAFEPSGDDVSLLVARARGPLSEGGAAAALDRLGFAGGERLAFAPMPGEAEAGFALMAVPGFVEADDSRLGPQDGTGPVAELALIGGYARPVAAAAAGDM